MALLLATNEGLHVLSSRHIVIEGFREGRGGGDGGGDRVAASAAKGEGEGEGEGSESQDLEKREVSIRDVLALVIHPQLHSAYSV